MAIAFGQECHLNSKHLTPTDNNEEWNALFSNGWESLEKAHHSSFVLGVFDILAFK
ncbi:MAG: hypothetical protein ACI9T9_001119 [Oleiphilaceae bacterium]|jgi:hypothetical protein